MKDEDFNEYGWLDEMGKDQKKPISPLALGLGVVIWTVIIMMIVFFWWSM